MNITSPVFGHGQIIPRQYARSGGDRNPPLHFEGIPPGTKSLALIMDDPDAPHGTFTHWILFNINPNLQNIREGSIPEMARQGATDWGEAKYGGPQPPSGEHRYFFHLFALDAKLDLPGGATRPVLEKEMSHHVLDKATLMGRYAAERR